MNTRRPIPRLVKLHRSYSVAEIARLFGKHKNTVRAWIKAGLKTIDGKHPALIRGHDLREFLYAQRAAHKKHCGPGEMYCLRCREPRKPAGGMADFKPVTAALGNLIGMCSVCECIMYRRVSRAKIGLIRADLDITFMQAVRHIGETSQPSLNSYSGKEGQNHENP